jgi:hypothetical protein
MTQNKEMEIKTRGYFWEEVSNGTPEELEKEKWVSLESLKERVQKLLEECKQTYYYAEKTEDDYIEDFYKEIALQK